MNYSPEDFDYVFSYSSIAQAPASPRDAAKLLIYNKKTKQTQFSTFLHLADYLPANTTLVLNDTKVLPARITATKETGGSVQLLYLQTDGGVFEMLSNKKLAVGSILQITAKLKLRVERVGSPYLIKPLFAPEKIFSVLQKHGTTPIPPYIKNSPLSEKSLREKYQTIFSKTQGSVAAPTASLHFSKRLMEKLKKKGIRIRYVTLHVGLGTFAAITQKNIDEKKLHREWYSIDEKTARALEKDKASGRFIIGVGTTVVRTLESAATTKGKLQNLQGATSLFIQPGYRFKMIDGMITNFHVPKSSLLMLVSALVPWPALKDLYMTAIKKGFKLFSFGEGMLIY